MNWLSLHSESEKLASEAYLAKQAKKNSEALRLFRDAAYLEQEALSFLSEDKRRTFGILTSPLDSIHLI